MRSFNLAVVTVVATLAALPPASAADLRPPPVRTTGPTKPCQPNEAELATKGNYWSTVHGWVHRPSKSKTNAVPTCAVALCGDGAYSFSRDDIRACSHHNGIDRRLN